MANAWEIVLSNKMSEPTQEPTTDNRAEWVDLRRKLSRVANFNGFVALTLDAQFYTDHPHVHGLHTFAQTNVSAFSALVLNPPPGSGDAWIRRGVWWTSIFKNLLDFTEEAAKAAQESIIVYGVTKNGKSVTWVNFSGLRCVDSRANTIHVKNLYEGKA